MSGNFAENRQPKVVLDQATYDLYTHDFRMQFIAINGNKFIERTVSPKDKTIHGDIDFVIERGSKAIGSRFLSYDGMRIYKLMDTCKDSPFVQCYGVFNPIDDRLIGYINVDFITSSNPIFTLAYYSNSPLFIILGMMMKTFHKGEVRISQEGLIIKRDNRRQILIKLTPLNIHELFGFIPLHGKTEGYLGKMGIFSYDSYADLFSDIVLKLPYLNAINLSDKKHHSNKAFKMFTEHYLSKRTMEVDDSFINYVKEFHTHMLTSTDFIPVYISNKAYDISFKNIFVMLGSLGVAKELYRELGAEAKYEHLHIKHFGQAGMAKRYERVVNEMFNFGDIVEKPDFKLVEYATFLNSGVIELPVKLEFDPRIEPKYICRDIGVDESFVKSRDVLYYMAMTNMEIPLNYELDRLTREFIASKTKVKPKFIDRA